MESSANLSNKAWFERACKCLVGGVSSPVRSFQAVGGDPIVVNDAKGAYLSDVEGKRYLDWVQSYGASILGHSNEHIIDAISHQLSHGTTYGFTSTLEVELAELIKNRVSGIDHIRFLSSGTEAVMTAVRIARGYTKRKKVIVFEGGYHGHSDMLLAAGGSGMASHAIPLSKGIPEEAVKNTIIATYNEEVKIEADLACVIVEPIAANMGLVLPEDGFLDYLRQICDANGALLIFDEVITGFRVDPGGASSKIGISPDLWCYGKIIGGGLPVGAVAGNADVMSVLAPLGEVYQAGTLSGNPLAMAAGIAALRQLDSESYDKLKNLAAKLSSGLAEVINQRGIAAQVPVAETLVGIFFSSHPVKNFRQAKESVSNGRYKVFFSELLKEGIILAPGPYEIMFPSLAHSDEDVERTIEAAEEAAYVMAMNN